MLVLIADCIWPSRSKHREDKTVVMVKELEEKHTSDLDNESERVSGDESTEEEGAMSDAAGRDQSPSESSVRKRTPQVQNTTEGK